MTSKLTSSRLILLYRATTSILNLFCIHFLLGLNMQAIETEETVQSEITCESDLPPESERYPPATITPNATVYEIFSDNYVFTKDFVESHISGNYFRFTAF